MRNSSHLTLLVASGAAMLGAALLSAAGCSSPIEEKDGVNTLPPFGEQPGGGGTTGTNPNVNNGQGGSGPGVVNTAGTEGNPNDPILNPGGGGGSNVGNAGAGPIVDTAPQEPPGGYFASGSWRGYAWTGVDTEGLATVTPPNFEGLPATDPFCFAGVVGADPPSTPTATDGYQGVALLGFNVNQELFGPVEGTEAPILELTPAQAGVAVNFTRNATPAGTTSAPLMRIQLQNLAGQFWCADLPTVNGRGFISYERTAVATEPFFRTNCWEAVTSPTSVAYARQPISAVVLTVPGGGVAGQNFAYDVCVAGFADANSAADAPDSISLGEGVLTGTLVTEAARAKVNVDGEDYIINNNAWGDNSGDGTQRLRYTNNSFEILAQSAGPGGNSSPASFPSIYIGANGSTSGVNGGNTSLTDNMPIAVSAIQSIPTTFRHNATSGDYNATYDVWFAPNANPGQYSTAQAAFLMVWTYKPGGRVAIGNRSGPITVDGRQWFLYVGPRGGGGPDANLPVISYVNEGAAITNYSFDLSVFIRDAVGRNVGLTNGMFLTDVFAGFEIWSGGAGLRLDEFTAVVNP
jgi:hypothetical protein